MCSGIWRGISAPLTLFVSALAGGHRAHRVPGKQRDCKHGAAFGAITATHLPSRTPRVPQIEHSTMEDDHFLFTSGEQLNCSPLLQPRWESAPGGAQWAQRPLIGTLAVREDQMVVP